MNGILQILSMIVSPVLLISSFFAVPSAIRLLTAIRDREESFDTKNYMAVYVFVISLAAAVALLLFYVCVCGYCDR
ncbi:MAG: hypothetical protein ACI4PM_02960 [Butyricicoccus sp.]